MNHLADEGPPNNMYSYRIEQAIRAASILHKDQVRKGRAAIPYISHLMATALIVGDYTDEEDVIVSALLHDTLEDTDYTAAELEQDFGLNVRSIVESLTEPDAAEGNLSWYDKKLQYAKQLKQAKDTALLVAAADKIHNLRSTLEQYYDHHQDFMNDFNGTLKERMMQYEAISNILNSRLKNDIIAEFNHVFTEYKNFLSHVQKSKTTN